MKTISGLFLAVALTCFGFTHDFSHNNQAVAQENVPQAQAKQGPDNILYAKAKEEVVPRGEATKEALEQIRRVSVTIHKNGRFSGCGTLFVKDNEVWCLTAAHVVEDYKFVTVSQEREGSKTVSVYTHVYHVNKEKDFALLRIGQGVFETGTIFRNAEIAIDSPLVHCGDMYGMQHSVTRGYLIAKNRRPSFAQGRTLDQADLTAGYGSSGGGVFLNDGQFVGMIVCGHPQRMVFFVPVRVMHEEIARPAPPSAAPIDYHD